jgi:hypothetical protein
MVFFFNSGGTGGLVAVCSWVSKLGAGRASINFLWQRLSGLGR